MEGLRLCSFTRIDSPVVSRVTAHRDDARSNERNVTELPDSSGRETKLESTAAIPTENPSTLAVRAASVVAERGEVGVEESGPGEASRRGERSRDGFFSSTRPEAPIAPGANAGASGDN